MKFINIFAAISLMIVATTAHASENVKGFGALPCSRIMELLNDPDDEVQVQASVAVWSWVQGHFTGKNLAQDELRQRDLTNADPESIFRVVSEVCPNNPDILLFQIAEEFYNQLPYFSTTGS